MAKVTGIVRIKVNGRLLRSKEGAELQTGGKERTAQVGHSVYGYSEKVVASQITCTLAHTADTSIAFLNNIVDATVLFECDSGVTYRVDNAFTTKPVSIKGDGGDLSLEMQGEPAEEQ